MPGGEIQLVYLGVQDKFLTLSNPEINFFKSVYRKYAPFSMESIEIVPRGKASSNNSQDCAILRSGDLLSNIYFTFNNETFGIKDGEIYDIIDNVEFSINNTVCDTIYNDYNAIVNELTTNESKRNALRTLLVEQSGAVNNTKSSAYYPLNFWFTKNIGMSIPLIALQSSLVKLKIKYGTLPTNINIKIYGTYIFLGKEERQRFANNKLTYLIEQVQRKTTNALSKNLRIKFFHPIKELIWVNAGSSKSIESGVQFAPLRNVGATTNNTPYTPSENDDNLELNLTFNNISRFVRREAKYFKIFQPYNYHSYCPAPTKKYQNIFIGNNSIDFTTEAPTLFKFNKTSRILNLSVNVLTASAATSNVTLYLGSVLTSGAIDKDATSTPTTILSSSTQDFNSVGIKNFSLNNDYRSLVIGDGYLGLSASSSLSSCNFILNIEYEELPTLIGGDNANTSNIYTYSFALRPEEINPSGTCNFSMINSVDIKSTENMGGANSFIKVFGLNYNVLIIEGGLGGLMFSS